MGLWYQELQYQARINRQYMEYGDHRVSQFLKADISHELFQPQMGKFT